MKIRTSKQDNGPGGVSEVGAPAQNESRDNFPRQRRLHRGDARKHEMKLFSSMILAQDRR